MYVERLLTVEVSALPQRFFWVTHHQDDCAWVQQLPLVDGLGWKRVGVGSEGAFEFGISYVHAAWAWAWVW